MGAVAARTERVALATSVTCPLFRYHPALVAQAAATIDRLSGGRFLLGIGTGEAINETSLGWPFPGVAERLACTRKALEIMHRLFAGEKLDFSGKYYTTSCAKLYSPPARPVPVLMAAVGPKAATFAGTNADGLFTSVMDVAETVSKVLAPFRDAAAARGVTDPPVVATR